MKNAKRKQAKRNRSRQRMLGSFPLSFGRYAGKPLHSVPLDYMKWGMDVEGGIPSADRWAIAEYLKELARFQRPLPHAHGTADGAME